MVVLLWVCCTFAGLRDVYSTTMFVVLCWLRFVVGCLFTVLDFVIMFIFALVFEFYLVVEDCSGVLLWVVCCGFALLNSLFIFGCYNGLLFLEYATATLI